MDTGGLRYFEVERRHQAQFVDERRGSSPIHDVWRWWVGGGGQQRTTSGRRLGHVL